MNINEIGPFLLHLIKEENKYVVRLIIVSNPRIGYYGELLNSDFEFGANCLEIPVEEYRSESVKAVTTKGGLFGFVYTFDGKTFSWEKKKTPFNIYYGKIRLTKREEVCRELVCFNLVNNYFDH